jgi:WD40 repeat protein
MFAFLKISDRPRGMRVWVLVWMGAIASVTAGEIPNVLWEKSYAAPFAAAAISHDGTLAAISATGSVQILRMANGSLIYQFPAHNAEISALAFSPDDTILASSGGDNAVKLWRATDWSNLLTIDTHRQPRPIAFSPSGEFIAIGNSTNIDIRSVTDGALIRSWRATIGDVNAVSFSPDGKRLASGAGIRGSDTRLKVWDVETSALLVNVPTAQTYGIGCLSYSPDGRFIATGNFQYSGFPGPLQLWDAINGSLLRTFPNEVQAVAFSPDSGLLLAAGTNVVCWAVREGTRVGLWPGFMVAGTETSLAFTPDGGIFLYARSRGGIMAAKTPIWISNVRRDGNLTTIDWLGGQRPFVVQRKFDIDGSWENVSGVLDTNSCRLGSLTAQEFYRVVSP